MRLVELNIEQIPEILNISTHCRTSLFFNTVENTYLLYFDIGDVTYKLFFNNYDSLIGFLNDFETSFIIQTKMFVNTYCSKFCIDLDTEIDEIGDF